MSESQRPQGARGGEIPDLVLEPARRSSPEAAGSRIPAFRRSHSAPDLFDQDADEGPSLAIELDQGAGSGTVDASMIDWGARGLPLERVATFVRTDTQSEPHSGMPRRASHEKARSWPSGRAADVDVMAIDPAEVALVAGYGAAPTSALLTPIYAYRVLVRQRELKRELARRAQAHDAAEVDREIVLAELARELLPQAEPVPALGRFVTPVIESERLASERGQALSSLTKELGAHHKMLDDELTRSAERVSAHQTIELQAEAAHTERERRLQKKEAQLKRVHIEVRAATHVTSHDLGPAIGQIPKAEAITLTALRERATNLDSELAQARAELDLAKQALERAHADLAAERQTERQVVRSKQALDARYQKELASRRAKAGESEQQLRRALADLGRALLAARGAVPISTAWLLRVQSSGEHADHAALRHETERRALHAFDRLRVSQGVRLACTVLALLVLLILLKLAL